MNCKLWRHHISSPSTQPPPPSHPKLKKKSSRQLSLLVKNDQYRIIFRLIYNVTFSITSFLMNCKLWRHHFPFHTSKSFSNKLLVLNYLLIDIYVTFWKGWFLTDHNIWCHHIPVLKIHEISGKNWTVCSVFL